MHRTSVALIVEPYPRSLLYNQNNEANRIDLNPNPSVFYIRPTVCASNRMYKETINRRSCSWYEVVRVGSIVIYTNHSNVNYPSTTSCIRLMCQEAQHHTVAIFPSCHM